MRPESLEDLADSLTRERALKGFVIICLIVTMAALGPRAHSYLPIILFALLADLMALNRLRRLVNTLVISTGETTADNSDDDDE